MHATSQSEECITVLTPCSMVMDLLNCVAVMAGIAFLVRLRSDLLLLLKEQPGLAQGAALRALSQDLR